MRDLRRKFAVCLAASAAGLTALAGGEQNLVAHYGFESLAGGKTPDALGSSKLSVPRDGELKGLFDSVAGQCISFGKMSAPITVENPAQSGPLSIAFWVKTDDLAGEVVICSDAKGAWALQHSNEGLVLKAQKDGAEKRLNADYFLTAGKWSHMAIVLSGTQADLYVNSRLRGSLDAVDLPSQIQLGAAGAAAISFDELRLYNRAIGAPVLAEVYEQERYDIFGDEYSRFALQSHLDRALFCQAIYMRPFQDDIFRMFGNVQPRMLLAAVGMWGHVDQFDEAYLQKVRQFCTRMNEINPDTLVGGATFLDTVSRRVLPTITIPDYVFEAFDLPIPAEPRTFNFSEAVLVDNARNDLGLPDMSKKEAQLWLFYASCEQIKAGADMIHIGILSGSTKKDKGKRALADTVRRIRAYCDPISRKGKILISSGNCVNRDGTNGAVSDGKLICDFAWFASTPREVPDSKWQCEYVKGHSHAGFGRMAAGFHPGGWDSPHLPWVAHLDTTRVPNMEIGVPHLDSWFPWGLTEIRWFSNTLTKEERNAWLRYMTYRVKELDPFCSAMMPAALVRPGDPGPYYMNTPNKANEFKGYDQEEFVKQLWGEVEFGYNREPITVPSISPDKDYGTDMGAEYEAEKLKSYLDRKRERLPILTTLDLNDEQVLAYLEFMQQDNLTPEKVDRFMADLLTVEQMKVYQTLNVKKVINVGAGY
ncbi:LamG domain-containing protein [Pontiella sulfatireligans]|uniref:LamG-like jellyroll fold domain-containing protein n=1 Tax=Pontiella sulfatireligans TaxID=2750658 RepID=A0A6C2UJJ1_9BACT|nr:LamG domain-containing protein [Pontiella sulfatireligans]VGO19581.1 hypothetical protein SCARR_01640 [Pontiella sulfatireligans]